MKILLSSLLLIAACSVQAGYEEVLAAYVDSNGMVDYSALSRNRTSLDQYIASLEHPATTGWSEQDWIAFWINAYNARTLQVIIDHYPVPSIKKIRGAWSRLKFPVLGEERTLDDIEHSILRKQFHEPRIHMALVCAARSCPKLRNEAYKGKHLHEQLSEQSRDFLSRPDRFVIEGEHARISPIFKWFKRDFDSVPEFIFRYSGVDISGMKIKYQSYDWSLNEQQGRDK
jgi:hypothetical protein